MRQTSITIECRTFEFGHGDRTPGRDPSGWRRWTLTLLTHRNQAGEPGRTCYDAEYLVVTATKRRAGMAAFIEPSGERAAATAGKRARRMQFWQISVQELTSPK